MFSIDPALDDSLTRRGFLTAAGSAALLAGCASAPPSPSAPAAARTFVDGAGVTVELPADLSRIVATSDVFAGSALLGLGVPLVGMGSGSATFLGEFFDLTGIEDVGRFGETSVEKVAALAPDLIVTVGFRGAHHPADVDLIPELSRIAPVVAIEGVRALEPTVADVRTVAGPLVTADAEADQRALDEALCELRAVLGDGWPAVSVTVFSVIGPTYYVRPPAGSMISDLLNRLGVSWSPPSLTAGAANGAFTELSEEQVGQLAADLLVYPSGGMYPPRDQFPGSALFEQLPAVAAGQVVELPYYSIAGAAYPIYTRLARETATQLRAVGPLRTDFA